MDVADWLRTLDLSRYEAAFRENSVSIDLVPSLTSEDLKYLGVTPVGHRRRLLDAIAVLRADADLARDPQAASADHLRQPLQSAAERRNISVMFCDMAGYTSLSSHLDPEDLSAVIRGYQACVARAIARFHGFIARYVGDRVLSYFGWPEASEADAESAVRAALAVITEVGQAPIGNETLQVRIGVATGLVVVGEAIGTGDARQQTAIGETPNRAARLQDLSGGNGIVIDEATRRQIGGLFDCIDIGPVRLKGLPEPVHVWQVLKEAPIDNRFEALHATAPLTPLVGRRDELDLLMRRWAQAKAGLGQVVMISGEPGIGKSRLAAELGKRLLGEDYRRLRYFCAPNHANSPLYPIIGQLASAAGLDQSDAVAKRWTKLRAFLASSGTDAQDMVLLGDLLGLISDDPSVARLSSRAQKEETFAALIRQVEHLCRDRPLLMLLEDVHWADPTTRELLDLFVGHLPGMRVLLVMTFRPELPVPGTGRAGVTSMPLSRLDRTESAQLAGSLTTTLAPPLLDRIAMQADGVPLFIEELTKAVVEGAVDIAAAQPALGVPTTLQGSLLARLDRLSDAKQVAQIGAVFGREFSYELVRAVADLPEPVLAKGLDQLVSSGLAQCRGEPPAATYRFKHALVQEAAYSTLLRTHRQRMHGRIADVLSARQDCAPQVQAHHLTEAGRTREAVDRWFEAGQRVAGRSAEPTSRLILHRMTAFAAFQAGDFRSARRGMEAVLELYDPAVHAHLAGQWGHDARTAALNYLTHILWLLGYPDQARRRMQQAFDASRRIIHSGSIGQVHGYAGIIFADLRRDPIALRHHVDAATVFLREHGLSGLFGTRLPFFQGMSRFGHGMRAEGLALAEQALARMSRSGGERHTYILGRLAETYMQAGQLERAWQTIVEAQSMSERTAEHSWDAELQRIAGEILSAKGADVSEVEALFRLAIETASLQEAKYLELRSAVGLARLLVGQGKTVEACNLLASIYNWFTEGFETADLREARSVLAELGACPASADARWPQQFLFTADRQLAHSDQATLFG